MALIYHAIEEYIATAVNESRERLLIVCPFVKVAPLARILRTLAFEVKVEIVTTWKLSNFIAGASDVEIFDFCNQARICLLANNQIHLKVWLIDDSRLLATSANITDSALGASTSPNHEFLADISPSKSDLKELESIFNDSIAVTDVIYKRTVQQLEKSSNYQTDNTDLLNSDHVLKNLVDDIPIVPDPKELYSYYIQDDSFSFENVAHDLERLKIPSGLSADYFMSAVSRSFFRLPIVIKVCAKLSETPMYFGEMKSFLQKVNDSDPKPTRRDLTPVTQNLYKWLTSLQPNIFVVDQPNYSERLSMIGKFCSK